MCWWTKDLWSSQWFWCCDLLQQEAMLVYMIQLSVSLYVQSHTLFFCVQGVQETAITCLPIVSTIVLMCTSLLLSHKKRDKSQTPVQNEQRGVFTICRAIFNLENPNWMHGWEIHSNIPLLPVTLCEYMILRAPTWLWLWNKPLHLK